MSTKSTIRRLSVFFILCLIFSTFSCSEGKAEVDGEQIKLKDMSLLMNSPEPNPGIILPAVRKDTNILLTVDTENITEETKNEFVVISDDRSDPSENSGSPSEHVALVDKNMKIYWSAQALNPETGTTVDVLGIFRKTDGGAEILDGVFRDPNKDGIVMGKIKNKNVEGLEYYNIMIRVNEETPRTFVIDPKIQMSL